MQYFRMIMIEKNIQILMKFDKIYKELQTKLQENILVLLIYL
jgi:hypothetical protein